MDVVDSIDDSLHAPGGQIGDGQLTAFTGYLVEATDAHWLDAGITAYDPTITDLYEGLGLDPQIHANPGPSTDAGGMDRTLESVLEAPGDEETVVDRVAAFVTERFATVDLDAELDDVLEEFSTTVETTAAEAPSAHADLVAEATDLAAERAVETLIQADFLDEEGDETDPDRTVESHEEKYGGSTLSSMRRSVATDD
ncbi:hypothetical protein ACFQMM_03085 [Saliphagus sp. GCM10025308]